MSDLEHVYDDIKEHDNKLPRWWLFTLFGAIVFAAAYWLVYHSFDLLPLPRAVYAKEVDRMARENAVRLELMPLDDTVLVRLSQDPAAQARGAATYAATCLACHGPNGEGLVGPNLTDNAWIHGGAPMDLYKTIGEGVLVKGMPAWRAQLGEQSVRDVVGFVLTMKGKNLPGKAAEGTVAAVTP